MRLVRAGVVRAQRKRSAQWREVQAARHRRDASVTTAQEHDARVARWAQQRQQQQDARRDAQHARAIAQPPALPPAQPPPHDTSLPQPGRGFCHRTAPAQPPLHHATAQQRPDGSASCSWWLPTHDCEKCRARDAPHVRQHEPGSSTDDRSGGGGAHSGSRGGGAAAATAAHDEDPTPRIDGHSENMYLCLDCGDNDVILSNHQPPPRTRRTDGMLCLTPRAHGSMRAWFGGDGTRLADARRARGDG